MSAQENKAIIREYFDAFNRDWQAALERYVTDETLTGHIRFFQQVFPDYTLEDHDLIAEDDKVVVRATLHGEHRGELMGLAPTGRRITLPFIIIYRVAGGKIVEHWMQADQAGMMQQLTEETQTAGI